MNSFEEQRRKVKGPLEYKIYKGVKGKYGVLRLSFKPPYSESKGNMKDYGCLFLEMAPPAGANNYNWDDKIIFKLDFVDIGKLIHFFRAPGAYQKEGEDYCQLQLYHDKGAGTPNKGKVVKSLNLYKKQGMTNIMATMREKDYDRQKEATVPISPDEQVVIGTLLQAAIPLIASWMPQCQCKQESESDGNYSGGY